MHDSVRFRAVAGAAFRYSIPVLLGYVTIGIAFGLLVVGDGHPWWLAPLMSLFMVAGAAQFMAIGFFASGLGLWEMMLVTLVVNARHIAYGLSLSKRFTGIKPWKPYLIFALTDETFALLSSLPFDADPLPASDGSPIPHGADPGLFMFLVTAFDQGYWVSGSALGALFGAMLPWKLDGLEFALTALFIVLALEQALKVRKVLPFAAAAACAIAATFLLGSGGAILAAMAASLAVVAVFDASGQAPFRPGTGGVR